MLDTLSAPVAAWIVGVISAAGHAGIAGLMVLESACIPLPSEIIMPFAGFLASTGRLNLLLAATGARRGATSARLLSTWLARGADGRWSSIGAA